MFNPRQYGVAQGSLIAKSIHQEDLQCNESSVNNRRKSRPPKITSAKGYSPGRGGGRGGRGSWRGGRGFVRGMQHSHRGGGPGTFASSCTFYKSRPQNSYPSSPTGSSSSPTMIPYQDTPQVASGMTHNPSSFPSNPPGSRHFPSQAWSWKGKSVMPLPQDENPRPLKRQRVDDSASAFEEPHRFNSWRNPGVPRAEQSSGFLHGEEASTHPSGAEPAAFTPVAAKDVKPPNISFIAPPHDDLASSPRHLDRYPQHIPTPSAAQTAENKSSTIPPGLPWRMNHSRTFFRNQPPQAPKPIKPMVWRPKRLQSSSIVPSHDIKPFPPIASTTDASSLPSLNAMSRSSSHSPPHAPNAIMSNHEGPRRPRPMLIESTSPTSLPLVSRSSDVQPNSPDDLTTMVKKESPRSPVLTKSPIPPSPPQAEPANVGSSLTLDDRGSMEIKDPVVGKQEYDLPELVMPQRKVVEPENVGSTRTDEPRGSVTAKDSIVIKQEIDPSPLKIPLQRKPVETDNVEPSLTGYSRGSVDARDPVLIKQEHDPSELIIPQRKLVTESCSFYPIPQNCRKSAPNYKNNRVEYFRKEYKRLREFGLTKKRVIFRDDGLVIEWTSPIPVWSDTLLPEHDPESTRIEQHLLVLLEVIAKPKTWLSLSPRDVVCSSSRIWIGCFGAIAGSIVTFFCFLTVLLLMSF